MLKLRHILSVLALLIAPAVFAHDVAVSWTASAPVSGVTVTGYNLYRSTVSGGSYAKVNSSPITVGVTFDDTGVTGGVKYFYVVTAVSSTGLESVFSTEASAQVPVNAPTGLGGKVTVLIRAYGGYHG